MIDILLLPFMCVSISNPRIASVELDSTPISFNSIISTTGNKLLMDDDYKKMYLEKKAILSYKGEYAEKVSGNKTYLAAEKMELPTGNLRFYNRSLDVSGSLSRFNTNDTYYINLDDRMITEFRFITDDQNVTAYVSDENRTKLFDVFQKDESKGLPSGLLTKGAYYLTVSGSGYTDVNYKINIFASYADSKKKLTIDEDFMSKYTALVWESDYVPGAVDPIDGTTIRTDYKPSRRSPWSHKGRFVSGELDKQYLYRSVYIWTKDAYEDLYNDVQLYKNKLLEISKNTKEIAAKWSTTSSTTGAAGFFVTFFPVVGGVLGTALGGVSLATSIIAACIGSSSEIDTDLAIRQCESIKGSLDKRASGAILSFKEAVIVKSYTNDTKYTKRHYQKIRFQPYLDYYKNDTYSIVEKGADEDKYPSYDARLRHGDAKQIISDCQGTFTAYKNYKDIKPLAPLEDE